MERGSQCHRTKDVLYACTMTMADHSIDLLTGDLAQRSGMRNG